MEQIESLLSSVDACAERLEELNRRFPNLAGETSRRGVEHWRQRKIKARIHQPREPEPNSDLSADQLKALATRLLQSNGLEDVLDILLEEHKIDLTLPQLIHLIGKQSYLNALRKDAGELLQNAISYDQIAGLWNDLDRPALGGPTWNARRVSMLVE